MTDRFVAVGASHKIATSDDGINWTDRTNGFTGTIRCIRYGDGHWVAIDQDNNAGWSNDGITWHVAAGPFNFTNALAYSGNEWIAVDDFGGVFRSLDGISWATMTTGLPGGGNAELMDVVWDAAFSRFYAVGQDFTDNSAIIMYSSDGTSWARHRTAPLHFEFLNAVGTDGAGVLVIAEALGGSSVTKRIAVSTDGGLTWTTKTTPFTLSRWANRIVWGSDSSFVAPGSAGELAYSLDDGNTWPGATSTFSSSQGIFDAAYGGTLATPLWVIVGGGGSLATSTDHGATWTAQTSGFGTLIMGVAFGSTSSWGPSYTFTANALLRKTRTVTFGADAELVPAGVFQFSADAVLKKTGQFHSFTGDAILGFNLSLGGTRNRHDRGELHFGTFPATVVAHTAYETLEDKLRYLWDRIASYESGYSKRGSFTANAVILARTTRQITANAVIHS